MGRWRLKSLIPIRRPGRILRSSLIAASVSLIVAGGVVLFPAGFASAAQTNGSPVFEGIHTSVAHDPQDWPTYLGNGARTSNSTVERWLTRDDAASLALNWSTSVDGQVGSSVAVVQGVGYFGTWAGYEYAVNLTHGKILWKTYLGFDNEDSGCYSLGIDSAPTVVDGTVYLGGNNATGGEIASWYALNASTGKILWSVPVGNLDAGYYNWASPLIYDDYAYAGVASVCDDPLVVGGLMQINLTTHRETTFFHTTPFNQTTNSYELGASIWSSPSVDASTGTIFVSTGNPHGSQVQPYSESIIALNASNISRNAHGGLGPLAYWHIPASESVVDGDFGAGATVLAGAGPSGQDLIVAGNKNGFVYALNATNLASWTVSSHSLGTLWQINTRTTENELITPAAFGRGMVFFGTPSLTLGGKSYAGSVWAVDARNGTIVWQVGLGAEVFAAPLFAEGVIIATSGQNLYAFGAIKGHEYGKWTYPGDFVDAAAIAEGRVFVGNQDGVEYALCVPSVSCTGATAQP